MQPAQLSLWPTDDPIPAETIIPELPGDQVAAAIQVLAGLIAKSAAGRQADRTGADGE